MPRLSQGNRSIRVTGVVTQGSAIITSAEQVLLPADLIAPGEQVFRFNGTLPDLGLAAGDLLIIEPRSHAASGELVIATVDGSAFVGRWWTKRRARNLLDGNLRTISDASGLVVLGAITLIVRTES